MQLSNNCCLEIAEMQPRNCLGSETSVTPDSPVDVAGATLGGVLR